MNNQQSFYIVRVNIRSVKRHCIIRKNTKALQTTLQKFSSGLLHFTLSLRCFNCASYNCNLSVIVDRAELRAINTETAYYFAQEVAPRSACQKTFSQAMSAHQKSKYTSNLSPSTNHSLCLENFSAQ